MVYEKTCLNFFRYVRFCEKDMRQQQPLLMCVIGIQPMAKYPMNNLSCCSCFFLDQNSILMALLTTVPKNLRSNHGFNFEI